MTFVEEKQRMLRDQLYYHGPIDGDWGRLTQAAYDAYQKEKLGINAPPWLLVAEREFGVAEIPGTRADGRILLYHNHTSLDAQSDEVAWCSSFMNYCTDAVGIEGTFSASARSWCNWGTELDLLKFGCIVVFQRGGLKSGLGHVALAIAWTNDAILCLGGNQSDRVCCALQPREKLIAKRWPSAAQLARAQARLVTEPRRI